MLNASTTVRWVLVGLGGETGLHTPVFENALLLSQGREVFTTELAPTVTMTVDMTARESLCLPQTRVPSERLQT